MTDEDERMDRARRIREMREGSRPDDAQADDRDESETDDADHGAADSGSELDDPAVSGAETDGGDGADGAGGTDSASEGSGDVSDEAADADGESTMHIPGAEVGGVDVDVEEMARQAGLASAEESAGAEGSAGTEESTRDGTAVDEDAPGPVGAVAGVEDEHASTTSEETRVLEFTLGSEQYCLDIEYVEEIVKRETVTRVPNTPDCVEGVVDLRGQITTILDPKVLLDIDEGGSQDLIVVFDPDQFDDHGAVGWVVDDVDRVMPVSEDEVNSSPVDQSHVNGVVDRDGGFVIWTTPELDVEELAG